MSDYVEEQIVRHEWTGNVDNISYGQLLVRCKDCVNRNFDDCPVYGWKGQTEDYWFCADGRKRDDT